MKFIDVATAFNRIEKESSRIKMTEEIAQLFKQATPEEARIIAFLSLGRLHPQYHGTQFNIAEKQAIKAVALLGNMPEKTVIQAVKTIGDVGVYAESIQDQQLGDQSIHHISLIDVYHALCTLEQLAGQGSQDAKIAQLYTLLSQVDPISAKFITRIVIGKLRLGFSDMTLLDALSYMYAGNKSLRNTLEDGYNIRADIGLIAYTLKQDGIDAIRSFTIQVGVPILPAAAERMPTAQKIFDKIGPCVAQAKLDGFRLQVHVDRRHTVPQVRFFSRNLQDMSHMFPELVDALATLPVTTLIAEGEAIGYDPDTGEFLPFQETVKRRRKHGIAQTAQEYPLKLFFFDLLYVDEQSVLAKPHTERRALLASVLAHNANPTLDLVEETYIKSADELERYFLTCIGAGLEGIVVKRPDAPYVPGKRNFNWIKLKRQEEGHLEDTIDVVILGYYAGSGKRAAFGIGAILVGVYNKSLDVFQTIAKVGTGFTDEQWKAVKHKCDTVYAAEQPNNIICAKELVPDAWCYPEIVCIIRADEITLSPVHSAGKTAEQPGYALRFPRFMGYRPDKSALEATTVDEIRRLYEDQF